MNQIIQTIGLEAVKNFAYHGWYPEEQVNGCWFQTDVMVTVLPSKDPTSLEDTVNYELLNQLIQDEMLTPQKLLETVVNNLLTQILNHCPNALSVDLKLRKLNPPMPGDIGSSVVGLTYTKE